MRELFALPMLVSLLVAQAAPEPVISVGHSGNPTHAAFVGGYLATAAWSNVAIIDLSSGITLSHLPQGSLVMALEASPAGDLVAVGACGHDIQLWSVKSRTLVRRFALPQQCAETVSFSPDGALLATGAYGCCSSGGGLQIWDVRSGNMARKLGGNSGIRHVVFGGDGRWVAAVDDHGKASVFEWPSGRELRTFEGLAMSGYSGTAAIASREGRYFAWLGGGLRVWDLPSGREIALPGAVQVDVGDTPRGGPERRWSEQRVLATAAEFLNDGRLAYVDGDQMIVMRLPDGPPQQVALPRPETASFGDVAIVKPQSWLKIRRDGLLLAGSRESRTVVWDIGAAHLRELTAPALVSPGSLRWSSAGVVAWADLESGVRGWDDRSGKPADFGRGIDSATALAFRRDGTRLAVAGLFSISVVDVASRRAIASRDLPVVSGNAVAFSPDGSRLAFTSSEGFGVFDGKLHLQRRIATLEEHTSVEHVAFSPDGRWIAAGLAGPHTMLRVWPAVESGTHVTLDTADVTYGPQPPAFSGDSRWLASFYRGRSLMMWTTASWAVARIWTLPGTGRALAFAPEGSRLAVASDGEAAIWDAEAGRKLLTFSAPGSAEVNEIAWSPDGRRLVSSADDGIVRFWNAADGRLLASLYMLDANGDWLLVAPDGRVDGSEKALAALVAWRAGDRVTSDRALTQSHRVPGLWYSLATPPR